VYINTVIQNNILKSLTDEAINAEIKERDKKIQSLVEMIVDLEARIKDQNVVLDSNNN
jgi:hypothetical protein